MKWICYTLIICVHIVYIITENCPSKCSCKRSTAQRDDGDWVKVRCGDTEPLTLIDDNEFLNIANDVVQLNLSNNSLTMFAPKVQFVALQKLDLSKNLLVELTENQFNELPNLRKLDLSGNTIKIINPLAFYNLHHLDSLKLNQNQIATIEKGTFDVIDNLKDLDISGNPLKCDCSLLWLLDWTKKMTVKLKSNPKCDTPPAYYGRPLRKIKVGEEIHCKSPAKNRDMPIVELIPDQSQVVFEGDSLKLECRAPSIHEEFYRNEENEELHDRVEWLWLDTNPRHHFPDILIDNRFLADDGLIDSSLSIKKLHRNHSGLWNCQLITQQGNHSKGITVMVISDETRYCPITMTSNNKGSYTWPRTVVNYTVTLPCESLQQTSDVSEQRASYYCSMQGEWNHLNTSKCPYISETTKILEQFAKVNLSLAKGSILESAKHLRNTSDIKLIRDVMDFVFATRTIYNYLNHLQLDGELGPLLLDIINGFMDLDESYIREANLEDNSCGKLVRAVERITNFTQSQQLQKSHIILEQFHVRREIFTGITCTWYLNGLARNDKIFHCVTSNITNTVAAQNKEIEASIEVPSNIFYQLQEADITISSSNLLVGMFDNGKFFPLQSEEHKKQKIVSAVVGVKLDNQIVNLSHPIYIMLKPFETYQYELTPPTPVWWNPTLNFGRGEWTSEGCHLRHELQDNLVFSCNHLGYYGLLQDTSHVHVVQTGAKFRFSHPAVYAGSLVLFFCLLLCIISYIFSYSAIQMPKKAKHSVINMWLSISLLCFIYVFGIYQTEDVQLCQIIGLILHYLTLSSLLWMCVAVNSMYKRLRKNSSDVIELQDDELPSDEPIQKPILGLYLVGWGIALIVCGISGAVNMKEYSAHTHCFLSNGPALSALYIPFGILLMVLFILFLLIRCAIYGTDTNGHLSEGTQATENVDLDLLEPNFPDCRSMRSVSTKTASSEVEDPEHAPMAQLKAHIIFLILYILAWCSCALATMNKYKMIPYEEDVFSIIYAILASLLGLFAFFFYCVARNDVRNEWALTSRLMRGRGKCFRSRNISDLPQIQIQPLPPIPDVHVHSRSSSRSSSHTKSVQSNAVKAAVDLNASAMTENSVTKINNVNLVVLHRQQYRNNGAIPNLIENPTHSAEMFYNPHQSTVARKFFKKQKRHLMKRNNLTARRPPASLQSDASMISSYAKRDKDNTNKEASMFVNNAKVNNTNIHVEHIPKRHHNLNILSDSCEDLNSVGIPVEKLLERERRNKGKRTKKKQNVAVAISNMSSIHENNMRSVSQQCTLEYSSEPISDSILDQKSPEKPSFTTDTTPSDLLASVRRENSPNMSTLTEEPQFYAIPKDDFAGARIYVNPTHEFKARAHSRASSVSATEIEELYQQIKRGPAMTSRKYRKGRDDLYLSDSEVRSYSKSEKDETTV